MRRLWLPRLRRRADGNSDWPWTAVDTIGVGDDLAGIIAGIVLTILFVIAVAVLVTFFLPFVLFVLELLVVPLVVLYKIVFRRPFTVQATSDRGETRRWPVVGWRASGEAVEEAARALEQGRDPLLYRA